MTGMWASVTISAHSSRFIPVLSMFFEAPG